MTDLACFTPISAERPPTGTGDLNGVRVAIKDLIAIGGHTSSFGHQRWRETHEPAAVDAPLVSQLRAVGAAVVGTTKMDQLAYSLIGNVGEGEPPKNVFDPDAFCGGSSSGSASAVAGGLADLGVGTDTAGSIRVPAAACGLYGLRPTHGRIDTAGVEALAPSFDVVGLLTRDAGLLGAALAVLAEPHTPPSLPTRIVLPSDIWASQGADERAAAQAMGDRIGTELGVEIVDAPFERFVDAGAGKLFARLQSREVWHEHSQWVSDNAEVLAADVLTRLRSCESLAADTPEVRQRDRDAHDVYVEDLRRTVPAGTAVLVPVRPRRGPMLSSADRDLLDFRRDAFRLTAPSTLGGLPQLVVPVIHESRYSAIGLIGARDHDDGLIAVATALSSGDTEVRL